MRLVLDQEAEHRSRWTAIMSIAAKIGCTPQTLLDWVRKAEVDSGNAATISRFSASGHDRLRFPVPFVPITEFVDTACPHNKNDHIRLRETKRFGKAVLGGGRRRELGSLMQLGRGVA